jgi:hypothetical protein
MRWDSYAHPAMFEGRRYDRRVLVEHFGLIRSRHPGAKVYVLADVDVPELGAPWVDCRKVDFCGSFPASDIPGSVFYCIFDSDERAASIIGFIIDRGGIFYPPPIVCPPASYFHFHDNARGVLKQELEDQQREGFDKWDCGPGDMINLVQCIDLTREVEGAFVEIGTYRGSSARLALRYMHSIGLRRICWFLDVFSGFDYEEAAASADRMWIGTHATEGAEWVRKRLQAHGDPEAGLEVRVVRANVIRDPLPADITGVALANIDVDMLEAVQAALSRIAPLVVTGGIMIVEDPGHTPALIGARIALDRFLKSPAGSAFLPVYMESGQTLLFRRQ